jgi:predicted thioredoxin/glutaredoxin
MNREPVNIEFILKGDIEKEIDKVQLSMKRMGTEGAVS